MATRHHRSRRGKDNPQKGAYVYGERNRKPQANCYHKVGSAGQYRLIPSSEDGYDDITRHSYYNSYNLAYGEYRTRGERKNGVIIPSGWVIEQRTPDGWVKVL